MSESAKQRPSRVRWHMIGLLMALCAASHLNRLAITVAGTERIMPDYGISTTQMGAVYTAFLAAYTGAMVLGGWGIDRLGPRVMLVIMGCGSALLGALTGGLGFGMLGAGQLLVGLIVLRALMGVFTTPLHPACARAVAHWVPSPDVSSANGWITFAAVLGMAAAVPVFGQIMDRVGWPSAFVLTAGLLLLVTIGWGYYGRDRIDHHPRPNRAERELVRGSRAGSPSDSEPLRYISLAGNTGPRRPNQRQDGAVMETSSKATALGRESSETPSETTSPLFSKGLVFLTLGYAAVGYFQYLFFYWAEYFFNEIMRLPVSRGRLYTTVLLLALGLGMPLGGWLADRAQRRYPRAFGWRIVPGLSMALSAGFLLLGILTRDVPLVVTFFALAMFSLGASESSFWQTAVLLGGSRAGTAAAVMNTGGNGIGLLAPLLTPIISQHLGWHWGLGLGGIVSLAGAACWLAVSPPAGRSQSRQVPAS